MGILKASLQPFRAGFQVEILTDSINPLEWLKSLSRRAVSRRRLRQAYTTPDWPNHQDSLAVGPEGELYAQSQRTGDTTLWQIKGYTLRIPGRPLSRNFMLAPHTTTITTTHGSEVMVGEPLFWGGSPGPNLQDDLRPQTYREAYGPRASRWWVGGRLLFFTVPALTAQGQFRGVYLEPCGQLRSTYSPPPGRSLSPEWSGVISQPTGPRTGHMMVRQVTSEIINELGYDLLPLGAYNPDSWSFDHEIDPEN